MHLVTLTYIVTKPLQSTRNTHRSPSTMKALLVLVVVFTFTVAMVPRARRETEDKSKDTALICAPSTPCAWVFYKPNIKLVEFNITNTYCTCGEGTKCQVYEDDAVISSYVHRCIAVSDTKEAHKS